MYHTLAAKASGELCLKHIFSFGAFARSPLLQRSVCVCVFLSDLMNLIHTNKGKMVIIHSATLSIVYTRLNVKKEKKKHLFLFQTK